VVRFEPAVVGVSTSGGTTRDDLECSGGRHRCFLLRCVGEKGEEDGEESGECEREVSQVEAVRRRDERVRK
jgi:hypothetical protein